MLKPMGFLLVAIATIARPITSAGAEFGTIDEARAMLSRAASEVKLNKSHAIARFNHNDPRFRDRDLFVFCFNRSDGLITAHEAMVGRDIRSLRDPVGKAYGEEMYRTAREGQIDEVTFTSPVPGSTEKAPKKAYVTAIGDQVCGVSSYQFGATARAQ